MSPLWTRGGASTDRVRVAHAGPGVPIMGWVTAYVDESLRLTGEGRYVLAGVVVPDERVAEVRAALRAAVPPRMRRYHWRKESAASRAHLCHTVARLDVDAVAVTGPVDPTRQERARRQCLLRLLWELAERGVTNVVFESRRAADASDRRLIEHAQRAGWPRPAQYRFAQPDAECLLWLPDVVAGAVARALGDGDPTYLTLLGSPVTVL